MLDTNTIPTHPGKELHRLIMDNGMNLSEFARTLKVSSSRISEIVHGKRAITIDSAMKIADYFDTTPDFWLTRQTKYDLYQRNKVMS